MAAASFECSHYRESERAAMGSSSDCYEHTHSGVSESIKEYKNSSTKNITQKVSMAKTTFPFKILCIYTSEKFRFAPLCTLKWQRNANKIINRMAAPTTTSLKRATTAVSNKSKSFQASRRWDRRWKQKEWQPAPVESHAQEDSHQLLYVRCFKCTLRCNFKNESTE